MAHILKKIGKSTNVPYRTFECDNESDLADIDVVGAPMGSRCYVINAGKTYALNSNHEWKLVPGNSGGGSDGPVTPDDPTDKDIIYDGGEEQ